MIRLVSRRNVALAHGLFMTVTGAWPVFGIHTFQKVTGPKVDTWLVKTVGTLLVIVGLRVVDDARARDVSRGTAWLGIGVAGALGFISAFYSLKHRISRIYLLDTITEAGWIILWLAALSKPSTSPEQEGAS